MVEYIETLTKAQIVFLFSALIGGIVFLVATFWLVIQDGFCQDSAGIASEETVDTHGRFPTGGHLPWLFQGGVGCLLVFGVTGLALSRLLDAGDVLSVIGGLAAGAVFVLIAREIDQLSLKKSSG